MTNSNLGKLKESYLASLKDPQISSELMQDLVTEIEKQTPDLLKDFQPEVGSIEQEKIRWSADYFSRQWQLTKYNFCRTRIEHLLEVKKHLKELGVKGFVPFESADSPQKEAASNLHASYIPSDNLQKFVSEGNLLTIRTALRIEMSDNSLTKTDLCNALEWAKNKVSDLLEPYSEKSFARGMESDQSVWDSQYYESQVVFLKTNFSKERFLHLVDVREYLRQQGVEGFIAEQPRARVHASQSAHGNHKSKQDSRSGSTFELNSSLKAALLIGGAVATLVALLITMVR